MGTKAAKLGKNQWGKQKIDSDKTVQANSTSCLSKPHGQEGDWSRVEEWIRTIKYRFPC